MQLNRNIKKTLKRLFTLFSGYMPTYLFIEEEKTSNIINMATNIATLDDLQRIKNEIVKDVLKEISNLISGSDLKPRKRMLKSKEVRDMCGFSQSKLENLMRTGTLPYKQIEGRG